MASKEKVSEKVQEAIFNQLLNVPGNGECADCCNKSPSWVSLDYGVFVCIRCSGVHRQLGPHITRVRSTRLDGWQKDNIEIMATVGNKVANDYYEHKMPGGYRKPGANSTPEECRRFVDEKYIRKAFAPAGYQEPVKEFLACRSQGTKPTFEYSKSYQQGKHEETHARTHSSDQGHAREYLRKKSMSLDKLPEPHKKEEQNASEGHKKSHHHHHHQDLLSPDEDLLGSHSHSDGNEFGDFKQATHSASPTKKLNFANFKKANSQPQEQQQSQNQNQNQSQGQNQNQSQGQNQNQSQGQSQQQNQSSHWDWNFPSQSNNAPSNNNNTNLPYPQNQEQQKQTENKVDLMKLYNQPNPVQQHQNHFMQGGWGYNNNSSWSNAGTQGGFQNSMQGGYPNNYGAQGFNQNMGYNYPQQGYPANMTANVGYTQGPVVGQYGANPYQNNSFMPPQNTNKFF